MKRNARHPRFGALGKKVVAVDDKLGRIYNRAMGWFCALVGGGVVAGTLMGDDFALATHWPFLGFGLLFLLLARLSLRSRSSLLETLAEMPVRKS